MKLRKTEPAEKHDAVEKTLETHEKKLTEMAKRLRRLEIEAGIFRQPLRKVKEG